MTQPPVSFQSGSLPRHHNHSHFAMGDIPGMAALPTHTGTAAESPLYAQQSSLSSSYFPEPSPLATHFASTAPTNMHAFAPRSPQSAAHFRQSSNSSNSSTTAITIARTRIHSKHKPHIRLRNDRRPTHRFERMLWSR